MSDSSKNGVLALSGWLIGLSIIAVGLRFCARKRQKLRLLADDWMAGLALVSDPQHGLESNDARSASLLTDGDGFSSHSLEHRSVCSLVSHVSSLKPYSYRQSIR